MSKYLPLKEFLVSQKQDYVPMTFAEIEEILAFPLPASKQYPAWWSNNPSNNPMTKEWLDAGYETESVNTASGKVAFRRVRDRKGPSGTSGAGGLEESAAPFSTGGRHPGFGFMKGLLTIEEGYDVTKPPSDEAWDAGYLGFEERK
jgi:hypothetical protein